MKAYADVPVEDVPFGTRELPDSLVLGLCTSIDPGIEFDPEGILTGFLSNKAHAIDA
jgi:hypothetical protein